MKILKNFCLFLGMAVLAAGFVACSDDDDDNKGGSFVEPAYESESAKYDVTSDDGNISSLELTASGNYIVTTRNNFYAPERAGFVMNTRGASNKIICGKFTKVSENEYKLEGFGTVVINGKGDAVSLEITPLNGESFSVSAEKAETVEDSEKTSKICRTWSFSSIYVQMKYDGVKAIDNEYKMETFEEDFLKDMKNFCRKMGATEAELKEMDAEDFIDVEEIPEQLIITKSGTYMMVYSNDVLSVSTWKWENESKGIIRHDWNYDEEESGLITVGFRGSQLTVTIEEEDPEEGVEYKFIYYLNEVK